MRDRLWTAAITAAAVSAIWFFGSNRGEPWSRLLTDPAMLTLGLILLLYAAISAFNAWRAPRRAYRTNRYLVEREAELIAREATVAARAASQSNPTPPLDQGILDLHPEDMASPAPTVSIAPAKWLLLGFSAGVLVFAICLFIAGKRFYPELSTISYLSAMLAFSVESGKLLESALVCATIIACSIYVDRTRSSSQAPVNQLRDDIL